MENPAAALSALFATWPVPGNQAPETARGASSADDLQFWRGQALAVEYLRQIERLLAGLAANGDAVEPYLKVLPSWYQAVFAYNTPWRHAEPGPRLALDARDHTILDALAGLLRALKLEPSLEPGGLLNVSSHLAEAKKLVLDDPDVSDADRRYLLALLQECANCIEEIDALGYSSLRSVTFELSSALLVEGSRQTEDESRPQRYGNLAKSLLSVASTTVVVQLTTNALKAITGAL